MSTNRQKILLIGDNPFHGISHLSQERARSRGEALEFSADRAANIVMASLKNGANGFSFSVSELTLSVLKKLREKNKIDQINLYAMMPYAFEYVRIATQTGTPGLVKRFAKQVVFTGNVRAIFEGFWAAAGMNPEGFVSTYLSYELSRIRSSAGTKSKLSSVVLNEVIVDMSLALNFDWLFKHFINYLSKKGIMPGFNTRNFPYLVRRFSDWQIDLDQTLIMAPFNKVGFQMNPSKEECEKTLSILSSPVVLAMSVLAAGYLKPPEAVDYIAGLQNIKGVLVGCSTEQQAQEMFSSLKPQFLEG
jgi:hypothetical protein